MSVYILIIIMYIASYSVSNTQSAVICYTTAAFVSYGVKQKHNLYAAIIANVAMSATSRGPLILDHLCLWLFQVMELMSTYLEVSQSEIREAVRRDRCDWMAAIYNLIMDQPDGRAVMQRLAISHTSLILLLQYIIHI